MKITHTVFCILLALSLAPLPLITGAALLGYVFPVGAAILTIYMGGGVVTLATLLGLSGAVALTA